jgi:hypothetical protein
MKALVGGLGILVVACGAMNVILLQRMNALEKKIVAPKTQPSNRAAEPSKDEPVEPGRRSEARHDEPVAPAPGRTAPPVTSGGPERSMTGGGTAELSPAVKAAMAKEVDRLMKEKYGDLPAMNFRKMEDPITVMERELGLSPNQKMAIADLWKKREEEMMKSMNDSKMNEMAEKMKEIEGRYDAAIKQQLDLGQQAKYDGLKKDGKLHGGGVVFSVEMKSEKAEEK